MDKAKQNVLEDGKAKTMLNLFGSGSRTSGVSERRLPSRLTNWKGL